MKIKNILNQIENLIQQGITVGTISKQYISKPTLDKTRKLGPYWTLTSSIRGKKRTRRISEDQLKQVRQQVKRYQQLKGLFNQLLEEGERI